MSLVRPLLCAASLGLAACTAAQPPAPPAPVPQAAPPSQEAPMAKRAPGDATPPMTVFRAFGTEPFWNVNVEGDTLTFTTPDDPVGVAMQGSRREVDGGIELHGTHAGKAFTLSVAPGECSDGMSDEVYAMTARFHFGDMDYTGCGEAAK